jgi:hypothetical protein
MIPSRAFHRILAEGSVAEWLVAIPGALVAIAAIYFGSAALVQTSTPDQLRAEARTLANAIRAYGPEHVHAFVRQGVDVNTPLEVVDAALTGSRRALVTPLVLAVAAQHENNMLTLLSEGATLDRAANAWANCVATWVGRDDLRAHAYGGKRDPISCPSTGPDRVLAPFVP